MAAAVCASSPRSGAWRGHFATKRHARWRSSCAAPRTASERRWTSNSASRQASCGAFSAARLPRSMATAEATWTYDASHYPEPMSPLSADVWFWAMGLGIQAAARELRAPFGGFDTMIESGGWAYERELEPAWEPDLERLERAALEIAGRWRGRLWPGAPALTPPPRALPPP